MIDPAEFKKILFHTFGFTEPEHVKSQAKIPEGEQPPQPDRATLRNAIVNQVYKVKQMRQSPSITQLITIDCDIPYPTYKQYISGKGNPSRPFIAKLSVGLGLSIEEANELFRLHSGELNLTNNVDYITYHALRTQDSLEDYLEELKRYTGTVI